MSATNFIDLFKFTNTRGLEDSVDRLSSVTSVNLLMLSTLIITFKTYVFQSMACYVPSIPSGGKFDEYVENYCWVDGTYASLPNNTLPTTPFQWQQAEHLKINYYQWIPLILSLQCLFFYFPRILWQCICYNKVGVDLDNIVKQANKLREDEKRSEKCQSIIEKIERILVVHRDYRMGKLSDIRRKLHQYLGFLVISKRLGTSLLFWYFFVKVAYLINAFLQMVYIAKLFETTSNFSIFIKKISSEDGSGSKSFPYVTYCYLDDIRGVSGKNNFHAQCSLPQNMLNEKLYLFLWFWVSLVTVVTAANILLWLWRSASSNKVTFMIKLLENNDMYVHEYYREVTTFVNEYLQHNGCFIIQMIYVNAGDLVATEICTQLFKVYREKYHSLNLKEDYYYHKEESMVLKISGEKVPTCSTQQCTVIQFS